MKVRKAVTEASSDQVPALSAPGTQRELILELYLLLTTYAPSWYTEELDIRLSETLAKATS